jgi:outer membrane receptor protein involved in Fe transport
VIWESEVIGRHYVADNFFGPGDPLDPLDDVSLHARTLHDWGFYTQLMYGFQLNWAAGLRYEYVNGSGDSLDENFNVESHNDDPFRDERHRFAPLVAWYPSEFSRFRFQYNFDHAAHISGKDAHSFWLGAEFLIGAHAAHKF